MARNVSSVPANTWVAALPSSPIRATHNTEVRGSTGAPTVRMNSAYSL